MWPISALVVGLVGVAGFEPETPLVPNKVLDRRSEHVNSVPGLAKFAEKHLTPIATEIATEPTGTGCDENGPITLWRSRNTEEMSLSGMQQDELRPPLTNQGDAVLK